MWTPNSRQQNEIDILAEPKGDKGIFPDFVVSIEDVSEKDLEDAKRLDVPIVKIKKLSYPKMIVKAFDNHLTMMTG